MSTTSPFQFSLEMSTDAEPSRALGRFPVPADAWASAVEWVRFEVLRRDRRNPVIQSTGPATIEPVWDPLLNEPYLAGFRVSVQEAGDGPSASCDFTTDYFNTLAEQLGAALVTANQLAEGEVFQYVAVAFARQEETIEPEAPGVRRLSVKPKPQSFGLTDMPRAALMEGSVPCGDIEDGEMEVFVPEQVLEETVALHEEAGAAETGGVLIGLMHRDPDRPGRLFVQVTAQIPVRHAEHELTRLTFTPETWKAADAAIRLRGKNERKVGWWHTHPSRKWCEKCPVENRKVCKLSGEFFSSHDAAFQRAAFPAAFSIALVISDSYAKGLTYPMFGWKQGQIVQRGFYRIGVPVAAAETAS